MKPLLIACLLLCGYTLAFSQDTTYTLSEKQFLRMVQLYHPVARQAQIGVEQREAERLKARGA